jgi:hypothetical protein
MLTMRNGRLHFKPVAVEEARGRGLLQNLATKDSLNISNSDILSFIKLIENQCIMAFNPQPVNFNDWMNIQWTEIDPYFQRIPPFAIDHSISLRGWVDPAIGRIGFIVIRNPDVQILVSDGPDKISLSRSSVPNDDGGVTFFTADLGHNAPNTDWLFEFQMSGIQRGSSGTWSFAKSGDKLR